MAFSTKEIYEIIEIVNNRISSSEIKAKIVQELPEIFEKNTIYFHQISVNPKLFNFYHSDKDGDVAAMNVYSKDYINEVFDVEFQAKLQEFNIAIEKAASGIKGVATQSNAPTPYDAVTYPDGLFETYVVRTPLTMPNSWGSAVTQAELDVNYVYFDVINGVITKEVSLKPTVELATVLNPTNTTEATTGKSVSDFVVEKIDTIYASGKNKFDKTKAKIGYYVNQEDGQYIDNPAHISTNYMPVVPSQQYVANKLLTRYAFFDVNKVFISGSTFSESVPIIAPSNAKFMVMSSEYWEIDTLQIEEGNISTEYEKFKLIISSEDIELPKNIVLLTRGKNIFDKTKAKIGFFINQTDGQYNPNPAHISTDHIPIIPSKQYVSNQPLTRYAFYDASKVFISGSTFSESVPIIAPSNAAYIIMSSEFWNINTLQIEEGAVSTEYRDFRFVIPKENIELPDLLSPISVEKDKKYMIAGCNIRTPKYEGDDFAIHNDAKHEGANISWVTKYEGGLRVGMTFTGAKVITMSATPHVSLLNAGYTCATTGGDNIHEVNFYRTSDGSRVNAEDVVVADGSLWFFAMLLI